MFGLLVSIIKLFTGCSGKMLYNTGYHVDGKKVFYKIAFPGNAFEIDGADAASFKVIRKSSTGKEIGEETYAVDKTSVYYNGYAVPGSDGNSFAVLGGEYAKHKNQCYHRGSKIADADPGSFIFKIDSYASDKNGIYKSGQIIDNNSSVFETFDSSSIVHTANSVSIFGDIVKIPWGASFKFLGYNYFALDQQVYFHGDSVPGKALNGFRALTDWVAVSNEHAYYGNKIIDHADPSNFELLAGPYAKDHQHVFFFEKIVEGADPKTFIVLNEKFQCARDKHSCYHEDKKISSTTAADMANKNNCSSCNATSIYFEEKK